MNIKTELLRETIADLICQNIDCCLDIDAESMTRKWIAEMLLKILMQLYKYRSCDDNNLAMLKKRHGFLFFVCKKQIYWVIGPPSAHLPWSAVFWRKLQMQLCAYPVGFLTPNCCKMHRTFILWQSLDFTGFVSRYLMTGQIQDNLCSSVEKRIYYLQPYCGGIVTK